MIDSNYATTIDTNEAKNMGAKRSTRREDRIDSKDVRHVTTEPRASMDSNSGVRSDRFEQHSQPKNSNSNRLCLLNHLSKCNEIFTVASIQDKDCSCQVSARLDHFLMGSKSLRIDVRSSRNLVGSVAWAYSRARRSLPKFERDLCLLRL